MRLVSPPHVFPEAVVQQVLFPIDAELSGASSEGEVPYQPHAQRNSLSVSAAVAEEEGPERRTFPTLEKVRLVSHFSLSLSLPPFLLAPGVPVSAATHWVQHRGEISCTPV